MFSPGDRVRYEGKSGDGYTVECVGKEGIVKEVTGSEPIYVWVGFFGCRNWPCNPGNLVLVRPLTAFEESVQSYIVEAKRELGL